jgi:hypothetical protein
MNADRSLSFVPFVFFVDNPIPPSHFESDTFPLR